MYILKKILDQKFSKINQIISNEYLSVSKSLNLIGSANLPFPEVLEALSMPFLSNPAEGQPGNRYFPHCQNIDELEIFGEAQAKIFFNIPDTYKVSLQPYSGTQSNQIIFNGILKKGDYILALNNKCGGHISHSCFPKKYYNYIEYGIDEHGLIDYESIEKICKEFKPKLLIAGASSYPREIKYNLIGAICKRFNVLLLADISHTAIYVASKHHQSPFNIADFVTLTTHKTTRGPRGGMVIYKKDYAKEIERSIFPITQGAPVFNEILSKVVMFDKLLEIDINDYVNRILYFSNRFCEISKENKIDLYSSNTDTHLVIWDLSKKHITGKFCEDQLEDINILVNRNSIPNDPNPPNITSGVRFGFLTLATLNFDKNDFERICKIIINQIFSCKKHSKKEIEDILSRYSIINTANAEIWKE